MNLNAFGPWTMVREKLLWFTNQGWSWNFPGWTHPKSHPVALWGDGMPFGTYFAMELATWREYPHKIWPYMVQYLHFRILKFPLTVDDKKPFQSMICWVPCVPCFTGHTLDNLKLSPNPIGRHPWWFPKYAAKSQPHQLTSALNRGSEDYLAPKIGERILSVILWP